MQTSHYRFLAILALFFTLLILLMPGSLIEYIMLKMSPWWPWQFSDQSISVFPVDKLVHVMLFALCAFLLTVGWLCEIRSWLPLFLMLVAYAGITEFLQYFIPGRGASTFDFLADGIGAAIGISLALMFARNKD